MSHTLDRRTFMKKTAAAAGVGMLAAPALAAPDEPLYKISLAEWSLHHSIFGGKLDHLDFAATARSLGIDGVEYVNQFFMDKAEDQAYLREMKQRADAEGVQSILIMCDREGRLGDPDEAARLQAVENHYKWVHAARFLGCHSIRVNGYSEGSYDQQMRLVADGLRRLVEFASDYGIGVIVENHGGFSSNGQWLSGVMRRVDHPGVGTLPDFGNFRIDEDTTYDSYQGVRELMPYAKGVSVKPQGYDAHNNRIDIDLVKMMQIVLEAGYHGYCGIEHGPENAEIEGIQEVQRGLTSARAVLAARR